MVKKKHSFLAAVLVALFISACGNAGGGNSTDAGGQNNAGQEDTIKPAGDTDSTSDAGSSQPQGGQEDGSAGEERDFDAQAAFVWERTEELLNALKSGDLETIIELGDPESDVVQSLEKVRDSETASRIIRTLYGDLVWMETPRDREMSAMAYRLEKEYSEQGPGKKTSISPVIGYKWTLRFDKYALLNFEEGTTVPDGYRPETADEAWSILEGTMEKLPLTELSSVTITVPDEDNNFCFLYDDMFLMSSAMLDELGELSEETMVQDYVWRMCNIVGEREIRNTEAVYKEDDETLKKVLEYITAKDFEGANEYIGEVLHEDLGAKYGRYDDLTDAQKDFVDRYIEEDMEVVWVDYTLLYRDGLIQVNAPKLGLYDNELTEWYAENGVRDTSDVFYFGTTSISHLTYMLGPYYNLLAYAEKYIDE